MPAGTIGVEAVGNVTEDDYRDVFVPAVRAALDHEDVRLMYVLGDKFDSYSAGAMWADITPRDPRAWCADGHIVHHVDVCGPLTDWPHLSAVALGNHPSSSRAIAWPYG